MKSKYEYKKIILLFNNKTKIKENRKQSRIYVSVYLSANMYLWTLGEHEMNDVLRKRCVYTVGNICPWQ